jgi:hypothetical protein
LCRLPNDYHQVEPFTYGKLLEDAGFQDVLVEDATRRFVDILNDEVAKLEANREDVLRSFSEADLNHLVARWAMKVRFSRAGEMRWGIYRVRRVDGAGGRGGGETRGRVVSARVERVSRERIAHGRAAPPS